RNNRPNNGLRHHRDRLYLFLDSNSLYFMEYRGGLQNEHLAYLCPYQTLWLPPPHLHLPLKIYLGGSFWFWHPTQHGTALLLYRLPAILAPALQHVFCSNNKQYPTYRNSVL